MHKSVLEERFVGPELQQEFGLTVQSRSPFNRFAMRRRGVAVSVQGRGRRPDTYMSLLIGQLSPEEQVTLKDYLKKDRLLVVRRTRPEKDFVEALDKQAQVLGTVSLTRLQMLDEQQGGKGISGDESAILSQSRRAARRAIKIYTTKEDPQINQIISHLNDISDTYEYHYELLLAEKEITNTETRSALGVLVTGVGLEKVLERIGGGYVGRFVSQVWGEAMVQVQQEAGPLLRKLKRGRRETITISPKQSKERLESLGENLAPLGITTLVTGLLSRCSESIYGLIPFVNTAIITAFQFRKRARALKHSLGNIDLTNEQREMLVHTFPFGLKKIARHLPTEALLVYNDLLSSGKIARGMLLGSLLATLFVVGASFAPITIPSAILYTLAGVVIENVVTLLDGVAIQLRDVYNHEFVKSVQQQMKREEVSSRQRVH